MDIYLSASAWRSLIDTFFWLPTPSVPCGVRIQLGLLWGKPKGMPASV
jgi:hypothetical protein